MINETMKSLEEEEEEQPTLTMAVAPWSQNNESRESVEVATLLTPVISECVNAVSTLLTPPPQGEMASAGGIPNQHPVPLVNSTCLKATCGGALLLAGIAGYGARAFMQRSPANQDGKDDGMQTQPETVQQRKHAHQESAPPVVQLFQTLKVQKDYYFYRPQNEIITLGVGQGGNQIHNTFWEGLVPEHKLDWSGRYTGRAKDLHLSRLEVYMRSSSDRYVPRSVLVDLEPGTLDVIKASPMGRLFKPDNSVMGSAGAGNNWAKGHYTEGAELIEEVLDVTRKELEECDSPQGFQLFHTLGGGTGSGMGTLMLMKLKDLYPDRIMSSVSVFPSPKVSDIVVEPYNAILSVHQLLKLADSTFIVDNEALYNITHNVLKQQQPKYADFNYISNCCLMDVTAPFRFPTIGPYDGLRKQNAGLVAFPRLKFLSMHLAPPSKRGATVAKSNVLDLVDQVNNARNFLSNIKPDDGKYLAQAYTFRGEFEEDEVNDALNQKVTRRGGLKDKFVEFMPSSDTMIDSMMSSLVQVPGVQGETCTMLSNTTANKGVFQRLATQFGAMYRRKAFLHWYKGEGMDEMEFQEADKNVRDLITEYQDKQDATYGEND